MLNIVFGVAAMSLRRCEKVKIGEAKILKGCYHRINIEDKSYRETANLLGKKVFKWEYPFDLEALSKKHKKAFIGLNCWSGTKIKFICIANKTGLHYFDLNGLKELINAIKG
ncbi:MAG: hypothetical protein NC827_09870 [Candidatus Omnitrophica bacterium]|nr:hypothetical protein [Candidatus Omnitrophota bacterium]